MTGTKPEIKDNYTFYLKPEEKSSWDAFKEFLWDPKEKRIFGRTGSSWSKIGTFYLVFYGVLAALVAICMWVFFQTLDPRTPKWQLDESLIGTNPGLGFRPMPAEEESTLIWYNGTNPENYDYWVQSLTDFLDVYKNPGLIPGQGESAGEEMCSFKRPPQNGQVCEVSAKDWHLCKQEDSFLYKKQTPCIFLKLNKIYGWMPEFFNDTQSLPTNMPQQLKTLINNTEPIERNTIWVSCEGENPADIENVGEIAYYPRQGFPGYYYPYVNAVGYLSPLVAVHFRRPTYGILINIECKAWARNIHHDRHDRLGSVHFELMID